MITVIGCNKKPDNKPVTSTNVTAEVNETDDIKVNLETLNPELQEITDTEVFASGEQVKLGNIILTLTV